MKTLIAIIMAAILAACSTTGGNIDPATLAAITALATQYATTGTISQAQAIQLIEQVYPNLSSAQLAQLATIVAQAYAQHPTPAPRPKPPAPNHTPTPAPNHTPTPHK